MTMRALVGSSNAQKSAHTARTASNLILASGWVGSKRSTLITLSGFAVHRLSGFLPPIARHPLAKTSSALDRRICRFIGMKRSCRE